VRYVLLAADPLLAAPALTATWNEIEGTAKADHIRGTGASDRIHGLKRTTSRAELLGMIVGRRNL
jgi:hypothetical protein